jgi:hypothetical protein
MELLYYKKGLDSCGTAPLIPLPIGIYELGTHDELTIEPNPFSDFTQLSFAEEQINSQLFLFNLTGSIVKSFRFNGSSLILEKEKLSEGTYFVRIINRDKVYSSRLIIQ